MHAHMEAKRKIENYFWMPRSNYQKLDSWTRQQIESRNKVHMWANNFDSRVQFVETLVEHMTPVLAGIDSGIPIYFVTFVLRDFAVPYDPEVGFDVDMVSAFAKKALRGFHSIGMVEAALYTDLPQKLGMPKRTISWHTHSIVWGADAAKLQRRLDKIRASYTCLIDGFTSAHCKEITNERALELLYYISKAPMKEYRISHKRPNMDWSPGDDELGLGVQQWKRDLRTGDRVRMCKVFADIYLDDLLFGTGEGREICDAVLADILTESNRRGLKR